MGDTAAAVRPAFPGTRVGRFVDAHVHLWRASDPGMEWLVGSGPQLPRDAGVADFVGAVGDLPLAGAVLVEAAAGETATRFLVHRAHELPMPAVVVCALNLAAVDSPRVLDRLMTRGGHTIAGVRFHPPEEEFGWVAGASAHAASAGLAERGLVVEMLTGRAQLGSVLDFAERNPALTVVLDHLGGHADRSRDEAHWREAMSRLAVCENVVVKLSGWPVREPGGIRGSVSFVLDAFGDDRVMFGSDWPMASQHCTYSRTVEASTGLLSELSESGRDRVMRANAHRVYRFERIDGMRREREGRSRQ